MSNHYQGSSPEKPGRESVLEKSRYDNKDQEEEEKMDDPNNLN
jgi:hypothetical protein